MRTWDGPESFQTTRWTLVLKASGADQDPAEALSELCTRYWYPVYAFVRRSGHDREAARDLTQSFFTKLLEKDYVAGADRERGRFRTFLLASLKHFSANEWDHGNALKRGVCVTHVGIDFEDGDVAYARQFAADGTPEDSYDRSWALHQIDRILELLRIEMLDAGHEFRHERLQGFLTGEARGLRYREVADELGMTEGAVKVAVHRMRVRFGELLRSEVAQTLEDPADVDQEIRDLFAALGAV